MGGLAHVLEGEGIATTHISLIREHTERMKPPRALAVKFELGRPFGAPNQSDFQRRVLHECLGILEYEEGPVIQDFPDLPPGNESDELQGWACPVNFAAPMEDISDADLVYQSLSQEVNLLRPWHDEAVKNFNRSSFGISGKTTDEIVRFIADLLVNLFYGKDIRMDTNLEYNLTTDSSGFTNISFEFPEDANSASIEATFLGGYIEPYDDTPQETELTIANVAISITKSPEAKEPFDINKYLPLFIGIPAALLVTAYYLYWTQKHKYEVRNLIKQMQKELNKDEDYRQIIIKSYHQLLNILDRYGFIKTKTQTVREFTDVMRTALPIPSQSVKLLTSLFEIARYSGIKPKVVDEFGMEMIDGSYNIWCVEAINNLHEVEMELNKGLKEGKVSRFTNIFGMRSTK